MHVVAWADSFSLHMRQLAHLRHSLGSPLTCLPGGTLPGQTNLCFSAHLPSLPTSPTHRWKEVAGDCPRWVPAVQLDHPAWPGILLLSPLPPIVLFTPPPFLTSYICTHTCTLPQDRTFAHVLPPCLSSHFSLACCPLAFPLGACSLSLFLPILLTFALCTHTSFLLLLTLSHFCIASIHNWDRFCPFWLTVCMSFLPSLPRQWEQTPNSDVSLNMHFWLYL